LFRSTPCIVAAENLAKRWHMTVTIVFVASFMARGFGMR
jgi:hypothetical protein